jgi:hypothetical protein
MSNYFKNHTGSGSGLGSGSRNRIRNCLKSRIRIRIRIRKKSFRIHNTACIRIHPATQFNADSDPQPCYKQSEPEFLKFLGSQASIPQNRFIVWINSIVESILERGQGEPQNEVDSSFKNLDLTVSILYLVLLNSRNRFFLPQPGPKILGKVCNEIRTHPPPPPQSP